MTGTSGQTIQVRQAADPAAVRRGRHGRRRMRAAEARADGCGREAWAGVCRGREWREGQEEVELPSPTGGGGSPVSRRSHASDGRSKDTNPRLWYHVRK